jgi:hypothetical protein
MITSKPLRHKPLLVQQSGTIVSGLDGKQPFFLCHCGRTGIGAEKGHAAHDVAIAQVGQVEHDITYAGLRGLVPPRFQ